MEHQDPSLEKGKGTRIERRPIAERSKNSKEWVTKKKKILKENLWKKIYSI